MELQNVESGDFYASLRELGIEFIKCRPAKITSGKPVLVEYDDPSDGNKTGDGSLSYFSREIRQRTVPCLITREFDLVILSDGIHASADNDRIAEICKLGLDKDGFLHNVSVDSGIYICGCARAPMKIDEAFTDAVSVAGNILLHI